MSGGENEIPKKKKKKTLNEIQEIKKQMAASMILLLAYAKPKHECHQQ